MRSYTPLFWLLASEKSHLLFSKEDGGDSHPMVLQRCQGSSVNIQMLPRIIDSQSGQGDVVEMEWRTCQEKRPFHSIQYLAF